MYHGDIKFLVMNVVYQVRDVLNTCSSNIVLNYQYLCENQSYIYILTSSMDSFFYVLLFLENLNLTQARDFFHQLEKFDWIDDATRLISLDFTVYNPSVALFAVVRVVFEKSAFGILVPWRDIIILGK